MSVNTSKELFQTSRLHVTLFLSYWQIIFTFFVRFKPLLLPLLMAVSVSVNLLQNFESIPLVLFILIDSTLQHDSVSDGVGVLEAL